MKNIKELVLTTIEEKLHTNNFRNISIDSIAKELHISKRTIYETFDSKEEIIEMTVDRYKRKLSNYANTIANKIQNGEITFTEGISNLMEYFSGRAVLNSELFALLPERAKKIDNEKKNIFMKFYELAVSEGVVRAEINKEIYFIIVQSCIMAIHNQKFKQEFGIKENNINNVVSDFMDIVNLGILTDKGKEIYSNNKM